MFFALKGDRFNGNEYAQEAIQKGASYAIIDEDAVNSDPIVVTGSHNWSSNAEANNDENTQFRFDVPCPNRGFLSVQNHPSKKDKVPTILHNIPSLEELVQTVFLLSPNCKTKRSSANPTCPLSNSHSCH